MDLSTTLIVWYEQNKRQLPWRETKDPYKIWLSEVILQQTRVQQGMSYYQRFVENFPSIIDLADAPSDTIMKMWQGLGYYSRARNMHETAQRIKNELNGQFPASYQEIVKLKGVGTYTAAAIASLAFEEAVAVVDGNVYRVLSRIYGIDLPIDSTQGKKQFAELAQNLVGDSRPSQHNQAMMEFGALQCTPKSPDCSICPVALSCEARKAGTINLLPVKSKIMKQVIRYFYYLVVQNKGGIYLRRREEKDIWNNLYEFPMIESKDPIDIEQLMRHEDWLKWLPDGQYSLKNVGALRKHILTHQLIFNQFIEIDWLSASDPMSLENEFSFVPLNDLENYAVPKPLERFIEDRLA